MKFGRKGYKGKLGHYVYTVTEPMATHAWEHPLAGTAGVPTNVVELKGQTKKGGTYGVLRVPPSKHHKSGETITYAPGCGPWPTATTAAVVPVLDQLAIAALLAEKLPPESKRHDFCWAVASQLARFKWPEADATKLLTLLYDASDDDELRDKIEKDVSSTYARHAAGEPITSRAELETLLGENGKAFVAKIRKYAGDDDRIILNDREHVNVDKIDEIFAQEYKQHKIFARGEDIVKVVTEGVKTSGYYRPEGNLHFATLNTDDLRLALSRTDMVFKYDGRRKKDASPKPADAPDALLKAVLSRMKTETPDVKMKFIDTIQTVPVVRPDGSLNTDVGYHADTGVWYDPGGRDFKEVPVPTNAKQARALMDKLGEIFSEFCYERKGDEEWYETTSYACTLAAIFFGVLRHLLPCVPMTGVSATTQGSGKTILTEALGISATGHKLSRIAYDGKVEFDKTIAVPLQAGDQYILIDNVPEGRPLRSTRLEIVLTTSDPVGFRKLGETKVPYAHNRSVVITTGNNLKFGGALPRRSLMIVLDPNVEHPENRHFDFDPPTRALEQFSKLVMNVIAVAQWWIRYLNAGGKMPDFGANAAKEIGSFGEVNRLVRAPLMAMGFADIWASQADVQLADVDRENSAEVFAALRDEFPNKKSITIAAIAANEGRVKELLLNPRDGRWNPKYAGTEMGSKMAGRVFDGWKLARDKVLHGVVKYYMELVEPENQVVEIKPAAKKAPRDEHRELWRGRKSQHKP
jgi:hypothetical protein